MRRLLCLALAGLCISSPATAQLFDFTLTPASSSLNGPLSVTAETIGTLVGDYDATTNPTGTRTKPGLFGTFGATENVAVATSLDVMVNGPVSSGAAGMFQLDLNPGAGTLSMTNFTADFLNSGAVNLPLSLGLLYDSFRTRNPTSTYPGGFPLTVPLGQASLTQLAGTQVGSGAGVLTATGVNTYDFSLAALLLVTGDFSALGNSFQLPGLPTPATLTGSIIVNGNTATLTSLAPILVNGSTQPGLALPRFPLALPTVLPAGGTSNLLLDLTVTDLGLSFNGNATFNATGAAVVPVPAAAWLFGSALAGLRLVRRGRGRRA